MKSYTDRILEKMKDSKYIDLSFDFAFKLTNESERGAVLIGGSKVEEYLEKLLLSVFPVQTKSYTARLLNYPGPVSSFSGKIELSYAFRLIDKQVYDSLNALRRLRNEAAHSANSFSLKDSKDKLQAIYNFESRFPEVIHRLAYDKLIKWKLHMIKEAFEKEDMLNIDYVKIWNERYPNPEEDESIQEQLIIWKLAHGLTFLCTKIEVITEELLLLNLSSSTWINLLDNLNENK